MTITTLAGVPPLWVQLLEAEWPAETAARLKRLTNSGGALTPRHGAGLRERFPHADLYPMYGLTEAFRSTYLEPALVDAHPDSIGRAIPFAEVMVVRPDGSRAAPGEPGELVHAGPLVAQGYWRDAERTAQRFRPAPEFATSGGMAVWSGDTVVEDADGLLRFVGRDDEMIKSAGNRISPTEIEEAVLAGGERGRGGGVRRAGRAAGPGHPGGGARRRSTRGTICANGCGASCRASCSRRAMTGGRNCRAMPMASSTGGAEGGGDVMNAEPCGPIPPEFRRPRCVAHGSKRRRRPIVYDFRIVAARIARLRAALPAGVDLHYAIKANPLRRCSRRSRRWSTGSTSPRRAKWTGRSTSWRRSAISFAGPGKRDAEIELAIRRG